MEYFFGLILFVALVILSIIDIRSYRLPNIITYPLALLGLVHAYALELNLSRHILGMCIGYTVFVIIEITFKHIRGKNGLGRGDAKLLAAGGAWCGWMALPYIVLIGSMSGIVMILIFQKNKTGAIAFGPALALGIFIMWLVAHFSEYLPEFTLSEF